MEGGSRLWIEKFRPKTFNDVKGHDAIVERLKGFVKQQNIPHLLFTGPAGVGKTSLILVVAREFFGENWRQNFLELNASDDRGIDVVRNTIKDFARTKAIGNVPFKIIYLDECDSLTTEAQQALRRTMENYTDSTRFCLSCNYSSKIIDPIQSRCAIFRFKQLNKDAITEIINIVADNEGLKIDEEAINSLYEISNGDVRRVQNILQSCASANKNINKKLIYEIVSVAEPKEVINFLNLAMAGDFLAARKKMLDIMLKHGLSGVDLVKQIQKEIWNLGVNDAKKVEFIEKCGEAEFRIVEGSDEFIQLESLLASFVKNAPSR